MSGGLSGHNLLNGAITSSASTSTGPLVSHEAARDRHVQSRKGRAAGGQRLMTRRGWQDGRPRRATRDDGRHHACDGGSSSRHARGIPGNRIMRLVSTRFRHDCRAGWPAAIAIPTLRIEMSKLDELKKFSIVYIGPTANPKLFRNGISTSMEFDSERMK